MGCFSKLIEIDAQTHGDWWPKSMSLVVKVNEIGAGVSLVSVFAVILQASYASYADFLRMRHCLLKFIFSFR